MLFGCIGAGSVSTIKENQAGGGSGATETVIMPFVTGIDLLGAERQIPNGENGFEGQKNLVVFAFEREHQEDVNTWIAMADELMAQYYDLRFYEVPVIEELNAAYRLWVNNGMRSGIPGEKARERTITVYTDVEKFTRLMDMQTDRIYLFLMDQNGRTLWRTEGPAQPEDVQDLKRFL